MSAEPAQELAGLVLAPGELRFEARLAGGTTRVSFRNDSGAVPSPDAALAAALMPAMRSGGSLRIAADLSPRVARRQRDFQAIQQGWSRGWNLPQPPLREVEVEAGRRSAVPATPSGRVAAFFSGGVDSWATVLSEPELTDLIFVRGIDIVPHLQPQQEGLADRVEPLLRAAAAELGLGFHAVETDTRRLGDAAELDWQTYSSCPLVATALCFEGVFDRVLIPSDTDHATQADMGSADRVNQIWSTESLEIVDHGGAFGRFERTRRIAWDPVVRRTLRVCWQNRDGRYNCGECHKCNLTMFALEALGVLDRFPTFPPGLHPEVFADYTPTHPIQLTIWEDLVDGLRECGREDLAAPIVPVIERGELGLGRRRAQQAEARAEAAEAAAATILGSRSWRLAEPLRRLGARGGRRRGA